MKGMKSISVLFYLKWHKSRMNRTDKIAIAAASIIAGFVVILVWGLFFALFYAVYVLIFGLGIPILILAGMGFCIYLLVNRLKGREAPI